MPIKMKSVPTALVGLIEALPVNAERFRSDSDPAMQRAVPASGPPTIHAPAARSISEDDLPVARTEIELSAPPTTLVLAESSTCAPKILALVRLHAHPLGTVVLDGRVDRGWGTHAPMVWSTVREAVNAHLATDGLPPVNDPDS